MMWGPYGGFGGYGGFGAWMWISMLVHFLLWGGLFLLIIVLVGRYLKKYQGNTFNDETPLEILKRRYAAGEIDSEEFHRRKKEL